MSSSDPRATDPPAPLRNRPVIAVFASHWLGMIGLGLVLTAIVLWSLLLSVRLRAGQDNPYIGVAMAGVGAVFLLGLIVTPIGLYCGRRRLQQRLAGAILDRRVAWRRFLVFLLVTSVVNVVIASQMGLRVVHHMESRGFCASCHVMTPESRAFEQGPHAGLLCVDCHVGEGTHGFLASKLQGATQLMSVLMDRVDKPIEGAIAAGHMVPSEETCEGCHWKGQAASVKLKILHRYSEDEANTPETTLLTMNVGGTRMGGIHGAHHGDGIEISFVASDRQRQDIPLVEYRNARTGVNRTYVRAGSTAAAFEGQPRIRMQCFDCHNRAAHAFEMPDRAVDQAITLGRMSADLPFLKKTAMAILRSEYATSAAAAAEIPGSVTAYYEKSHPDVARSRAADIQQAGKVLADIWSRNVFPELGVTWGTYPDNRGHETAPGCFRCHEGKHGTEAGEELTKNCFVCHHPAAVADTKPEVLELLGLDRLLRNMQKK